MVRTTTPIDDIAGERMAALVASLPCLDGVPGTRPFDPAVLTKFIVENHLSDLGFDAAAEDLDRQVAAGFLVWLHVQCLSKVAERHPRFELNPMFVVSKAFTPYNAAFYTSGETRRAIAAWLVDPWLPEIEGWG